MAIDNTCGNRLAMVGKRGSEQEEEMKAWIVSATSEEWCSLFHANTSGKAKLRGLEEYNLSDFTEMRARRLPGLDDKPITYQNAKDAGFQYGDGGYSEDGDGDGHLLPSFFSNDCRCEICDTSPNKEK